MKRVIASALLLSSFAACAETTVDEELPVIPGSNSNEMMLSTMNIPERASVLVSCNVTLPHHYKSQFSFYVTPRVGDFGAIEKLVIYSTSSEGSVAVTQYIGSKMYIGRRLRTKSFLITHVKQSNEAIVFDLSTMPGDTTVSCTF